MSKKIIEIKFLQYYAKNIPREIKKVKLGFYNNFLLPKKIAISSQNYKKNEELYEEQIKKFLYSEEEFNKIIEKLNNLVLTINRNGSQNLAYEALTVKTLENFIKDSLNFKNIKINSDISKFKQFGIYDLDVLLFNDKYYTVKKKFNFKKSN